MDKNNLMLGDWVNLSDVDNEIIPCKVVELHTDDLLVIQPNDTACDLVGYDMIRPIPLSTKIIKKNGFAKVDKYEWRTNNWVTRYRYYDDAEGIADVTFTPKYDGFSFLGHDVNNAHQLQHALRLCGMNDLADNFKI